VKFRL